MKEELEKAITKYREARTSLEAYRAISDFVQIILTLPKFIKAIEDEGEKINSEQRELNKDKGYHLSDKDRKAHNEWRAKKSEALFQLDPYFPFLNLYKLHEAVQPEVLLSKDNWLFSRFGAEKGSSTFFDTIFPFICTPQTVLWQESRFDYRTD